VSVASLATVSPADMARLTNSAPTRTDRQDQPAPASPGTFFKTKKGMLALVLVAAGAGFTVWSINHDRKPVKSPVR
jgi:hypothetical protein